MIHLFFGELTPAKSCIEKGSKILEDSRIPFGRTHECSALGNLYYELEEYNIAEMYAKEALALSIKNNERHQEGLSRILLGKIAGKSNYREIAEAEKNILEGIMIFEALKNKAGSLQGYFSLGELYANAERKEDARENLNKAVSMCREMGIEYWPDKIQEVLDRL
jgi:tetratricopeptide (TPR) repeat protein